MSRLSIKTLEKLDTEQREVWDYLLASRSGAMPLIGPDGGLIGPFNAMVHAPVVGGPIAAAGQAVRFETSLDRRLQELAIITVGAHWKSEFEFWAHGRMAIDAGVSQAVVDAIAAGDEPDFDREDEASTYAFTSSLLRTSRVEDNAYAAVVDLLGETATVELLATVGHYCTISLTLNAFDVQLPEGAVRRWPDATA